jgi:ferritin
MEEIDPKALDIFAPIVTENKLVDPDGVQHPKPRPDDPDELFAQALRDLKRVLTLFEQWVEIKKEKRDAGR